MKIDHIKDASTQTAQTIKLKSRLAAALEIRRKAIKPSSRIS